MSFYIIIEVLYVCHIIILNVVRQKTIENKSPILLKILKKTTSGKYFFQDSRTPLK